MVDFIVLGILFIIVSTSIFYIWCEKKQGKRCIGCPSGGCCSGKGCCTGEGCGNKKQHSGKEHK